MTHVRILKTNARGMLVGESNPNTRWPDSMVAQAKALRAEGWAIRSIAQRLGPHHATVWRWVTNQVRRPAARVVVRRVRSKSFDTNHQRAGANLIPMGAAANPANRDTDKDTDKGEFDDLA